jgi:hypothetical protein
MRILKVQLKAEGRRDLAEVLVVLKMWEIFSEIFSVIFLMKLGEEAEEQDRLPVVKIYSWA